MLAVALSATEEDEQKKNMCIVQGLEPSTFRPLERRNHQVNRWGLEGSYGLAQDLLAAQEKASAP